MKAVVPVLVAAMLSGCGYRVSGRADLLPKEIRSICIPEFANATVRYKLTDRLPEAIAREFIARTRYQVVNDPNEADAVLRGAVINYISYPVVFDQQTGRASTVQFQVTMQLTLTERKTGRVLYSAPNLNMRNQYEISLTPRVYFEESETALNRLSNEVARTVVSSILESF